MPRKQGSRVTGISSISHPCPMPRPLSSHLTLPWSVPESHSRNTLAIQNNKDSWGNHPRPKHSSGLPINLRGRPSLLQKNTRELIQPRTQHR